MKYLILLTLFSILPSVHAGGGDGGELLNSSRVKVFDLLRNTEYLELKDGTILESDDIRRLLEARAALSPLVEPLPENIPFPFSE